MTICGGAAIDGVTAVVLSYGAGGEFAGALDSLYAAGLPARSIVLVHNPAALGETPPSVGGEVEVVAAERNLGYAGGMNLGLERALARAGEQVLLMSHDARLRPGALAALLAAAKHQPEFGLLGPALVHAGSDRPFSFGGFTLPNGNNGHLREMPAAGDGEVVPCDWVDGGTMLIRTAALRAAGLFDARLFAYFEEADLCLRIRRAGAGVGVVLAAKADQEPGGSKRRGAWAYLNTRNGIAFARRAAGLRGLAFLTARSCWIVLFEVARMVLRRLQGRSTEEQYAAAVGTARGIVDYYRGRWGAPPADLPGLGDVANA